VAGTFLPNFSSPSPKRDYTQHAIGSTGQSKTLSLSITAFWLVIAATF